MVADPLCAEVVEVEVEVEVEEWPCLLEEELQSSPSSSPSSLAADTSQINGSFS